MIVFKPGRWAWSAGLIDPVLRRHLVGIGALWPMWEGGTTDPTITPHPRVSTLVGTNHGTPTSAVAWGRSFRGLSLHYPGGAEHLAISNFSPVETNAVTVLAVARRDSAITNQHIVGRHPGWFLSGDSSGNKIRFAVTTAGGEFSTTGYPISDTEDTAFVGCYDRKTVQLYVNGVLVRSIAETRVMDATGTMRIGAYGGGGFAWLGEIPLVAIWPNVALSPGACAQISRDPFGLIRRRRFPPLKIGPRARQAGRLQHTYF